MRVQYRRIGIVAEDVKNKAFDNFKGEADENNYYAAFIKKTEGDPRTLGIDAISPEDLIERTREAIKEYIDWPIWEKQKKANEKQVRLLKKRVK
jgi:hypothetical protein